jgi:di/tricarboxylate transporter
MSRYTTRSGGNWTSGETVAHANSNYEPMVCAYVLLLMAVYWITAALPLPVTSLIPLIAFPLFGVLSTVRIFILLYHINDQIMLSKLSNNLID